MTLRLTLSPVLGRLELRRLIKWNFTRFLVSPKGEVLKRYGPRDEPASLAGDIEKALPPRVTDISS